jgi:hypothetical protein
LIIFGWYLLAESSITKSVELQICHFDKVFIPAIDCPIAIYICSLLFRQKDKVIYMSKDRNTAKTFDALDWLAQLVTHIPNKGEQMVRYYGYYSNKLRGLRKKAGMDDAVPALIDAEMAPSELKKMGAPDRENIPGGPLFVSELSGPHENHRFYRG